jgi:tetratricopeptide (TPR) repeat protein
VVAGSSGAGTEIATDYQAELERIDKEIAELEGNALDSPIDVEEATRFIYRCYQRASLSGRLDELTVVEAAIEDIDRQFRWADLCMLKANIDSKLHRLPHVKRDLEMLPGLADSFQGRSLRADLALQEGRYEDARKAYETLIEDDRGWDNLARLAHLEAKMGDVVAAEQLYAEAQDELTAKEMRSYAWVEVQRGLLDLSHGDYAAAEAHYERADKAYSGYWLVEEHTAALLAAQGRLEEAVALCEQVAARVPRPELQQALGDLCLASGRRGEAHEWHEKALAAYLESARRGDVHYLHHLADFYADVHKDGTQAVRWARQDLELRRNAGTHSALAWALYRDNRSGEAVAEIRIALSFGVSEAALFSRAGTIHLAAGRVAEGERFFQRAAAINPRYEDLRVHG